MDKRNVTKSGNANMPNSNTKGTKSGNTNTNKSKPKSNQGTAQQSTANGGGSSASGKKTNKKANTSSSSMVNPKTGAGAGALLSVDSSATTATKPSAKKALEPSPAHSATTNKTKASKKSGPVLLGLPDTSMDPEEDADPFVTKIGGVPNWMDHDIAAPSKYGTCGSCGQSMFLLVQAYVPLETSAYDRVVYVWACNQRCCMRMEGSFRVARALKLNPEYAHKLAKKAKPSAPAAPAFVNPFAAPGTANLGNSLFGGSGTGFNNPFASAPGGSNPFAPPPSFGMGPAAPAPEKSFASIASSNLPEKSEEEPVDESGDEAENESTEWPENIKGFSPHYLYISEEVLEEEDEVEDIRQRYGHFLSLEDQAEDDDASDTESNGKSSGATGGATWSGEAYEKSALPKGVDKAFQKFTKRVQSWPQQCVRYDFPGAPLLFSYSDAVAQQLLPANTKQHSKHTTPSAHRIPRCPVCRGPRAFEMQLMPHLLSMLDVTSSKHLSEEEVKSLGSRKGADMFNVGMEWGTILVYSCANDCFEKPSKAATTNADGDDASDESNKKVRYFEEIAFVQFED